MGAAGGDDSSQWDTESLGGAGQEERIFVSVRLRPLNERESLRNDVSDWGCISNTTIIFNKSVPERCLYPTAYTFDRVFGPDCSTKKVYEEGAKEIALSVLDGFNSSIFAYGQTSSGKTYTMRGVTEFAIADIFDYMQKHQDREFVLKFSAMEIYNEVVRDLLSPDHTPLRLLDDPERGTVVEKLTEETLEDWGHLQELLAVCDAQRQIGETSLNEMSSRSHQIIKLTVESSAHEYLTAGNTSTLSATVNFIDLAGSERASQTSSAGTRLKEGSHINRSLLTLGTVIRKLSKGRIGHVPYRDSKLTRILQHSLGGNARTAIICTMSPAHSHLEQSKNTLLFASCAKEVATRAQVNVVMSDKALVKQLQREMARLENELKNAGALSGNISVSLLREKESLIEKMDREMKELIQQRDLAELRIAELLSTGDAQASRLLADSDKAMGARPVKAWMDTCSASISLDVLDPNRVDLDLRINSGVDYLQYPGSTGGPFMYDNRFSEHATEGPKFKGSGPNQVGDENTQMDCRFPIETETSEQVQCGEVKRTTTTIKDRKDGTLSPILEETKQVAATAVPENDNEQPILNEKEKEVETLMQKIQQMQKAIDCLMGFQEKEQGSASHEIKGSPKTAILARSKSCRTTLVKHPSLDLSEKVEEDEHTPQSESGIWHRSHLSLSLPAMKYSAQIEVKSSPNELEDVFSSPETNFSPPTRHSRKLSRQDSRKSVLSVATDIRTPRTKSSANNGGSSITRLSISEFKRLRREIIELWASCSIPLVHRTYFFLLFKGDPSDFIYMEVELRRLSNLKDLLFDREKSTGVGQTVTLTSSLKALNQEREMLSKQMLRKFSSKYRESLYRQWGIDVKSKQRRLQLARLIWTDTDDMAHIKDSAEVVARLIGFQDPGQGPKEMFGLSLLHGAVPRRSKNWISSAASVL
uniref:Kinesin-like protein n=1 Tax=Kalanchoe fedtschenkoi TaxID=63787 RepID=A0A7N0R833_KALFE